jgi:dihydroorotate dehydrogenase
VTRRGRGPQSPGAPHAIYPTLFALLLRWIPPERAHQMAALSLRIAVRAPGGAALLRALCAARDPALRVDALGLSFPSPLGVAAGLDKDATWFEGLGLLGFGFVEVGTVTARAQPGNPPPRIFRVVRDRALLNRMGFPNPGARVVAARLRERDGRRSSWHRGPQRDGRESSWHRGSRDSSGTIVGVNVGKSMSVSLDAAAEDYRACVRELADVCDYLVLNVSSPNTPGLREMQAVDRLRPLLRAVKDELGTLAVRVPLLVKVAPDATDEQLIAIADLALELSLDGIIAVNTTAERSVLSDPSEYADVQGGGVSGPPLAPRAVEVLRLLRARVGGRLVLISVGGVSTPEEVWRRILAGATLVQTYTGFVYGGPRWPARVNRELARRVRAAGAGSIGELAGHAVAAVEGGPSSGGGPSPPSVAS